jgi:hypothetical protein
MKASSLLPPSTASPASLPYIPEDADNWSPQPPPPRSPPRRHSRSGSTGTHSPLLKSMWRPAHTRPLTPEFGGLAPDPTAGESQGPRRPGPQSERPRRSLSSPFPLSAGGLPPRPTTEYNLPVYHGAKERFVFPLEKDRPFHPSSPTAVRERRESLNALVVVNRLTRVLGLFALIGALTLIARIGGDVLSSLGEAQWENDERW